MRTFLWMNNIVHSKISILVTIKSSWQKWNIAANLNYTACSRSDWLNFLLKQSAYQILFFGWITQKWKSDNVCLCGHHLKIMTCCWTNWSKWSWLYTTYELTLEVQRNFMILVDGFFLFGLALSEQRKNAGLNIWSHHVVNVLALITGYCWYISWPLPITYPCL